MTRTTRTTAPSDTLIHVIDDDPAVSSAILSLLASVSRQGQAYETAESFLDVYDNKKPGCVIVDLRLPGISGLELQGVLAKAEVPPPIIFLTGHGDVSTAVRAMKAGAIDFLEKPFRPQQLLDLIIRALDFEQANREWAIAREEAALRLSRLTRREHQVLELMIEGNSNNEIAARLGIARNTVENHRAKVFEKTGAESLIELARIFDCHSDSRGQRGLTGTDPQTAQASQSAHLKTEYSIL